MQPGVNWIRQKDLRTVIKYEEDQEHVLNSDIITVLKEVE
jgi:hypothetical protein